MMRIVFEFEELLRYRVFQNRMLFQTGGCSVGIEVVQIGE